MRLYRVANLRDPLAGGFRADLRSEQHPGSCRGNVALQIVHEVAGPKMMAKIGELRDSFHIFTALDPGSGQSGQVRLSILGSGPERHTGVKAQGQPLLEAITPAPAISLAPTGPPGPH